MPRGCAIPLTRQAYLKEVTRRRRRARTGALSLSVSRADIANVSGLSTYYDLVSTNSGAHFLYIVPFSSSKSHNHAQNDPKVIKRICAFRTTWPIWSRGRISNSRFSSFPFTLLRSSQTEALPPAPAYICKYSRQRMDGCRVDQSERVGGEGGCF